MIISVILITLSLDSVWISLGENWCWSPLGLKGLRYYSSERGSLFFYLCTKTVALKSDIRVLQTNIWTTNLLFLSPQNNVFLNFIFLGSKLPDSSLNQSTVLLSGKNINYGDYLKKIISPSELGILNATPFSLNLWYCILKSSDKKQIQCKVHSVYFVINFNLWFCFNSWSKNAQ